MKMDEKEARRMLDPNHPAKVPTLERALTALGRRAEVAVTQPRPEAGVRRRDRGQLAQERKAHVEKARAAKHSV